jgi:hypothetical protein
MDMPGATGAAGMCTAITMTTSQHKETWLTVNAWTIEASEAG